MADESQKVNKNGRPTLVLKREHLDNVVSGVSTASDWAGYVKDTADVMKAENNNIRWGALHSKNVPLFSKERLKKAKEFKVYSRKPSGRIFNGNQHTTVLNTKKAVEKIDKIGSKGGNAADGAEIILAIQDKDAKKLAEKTSQVVLSKVGEKAGEHLAAKVVGRCTESAVKSLDPRKIGVGVTLCGIAGLSIKYGLESAGEKAGEKIGKRGEIIKTAEMYIEVDDKMRKNAAEAEQRRRAREIQEDPMSEYNLKYSD